MDASTITWDDQPTTPVAKSTATDAVDPNGIQWDAPAQEPSTQAQSTIGQSTGNAIVDFGAEVERGALNSFAQATDMAKAAVDLVKHTTQMDMDGGGQLRKASQFLKQQATQLPHSESDFAAMTGQFLGSIPATAAEFVGTGGPVGFIARSAILGALSEYSKDETAMSLVKGAVVDGTIGALFTKVPAAMEGFAKVTQKFGATGGRAYIKATTGASDTVVDEIMTTIAKNPYRDVPESQIQAYLAKNKDAAGLSRQDIVRRINAEEGRYELSARQEVPAFKESAAQEKALLDQTVSASQATVAAEKSRLDAALAAATEKAQTSIAAIKDFHTRLTRSFDQSMADRKLATGEIQRGREGVFDASMEQEQTKQLAESAKLHLDNKDALVVEGTQILSNAQQKLSAMEKAEGQRIGVIRQGLEKKGQSFVPSDLIKARLNKALAANKDKGVFAKVASKDAMFPTKGTTTAEAKQLGLAPGMTSNASDKLVETIKQMGASLVTSFEQAGTKQTSLAAIYDQMNTIDNILSKGFNGAGIGTDMAAILKDFKDAINPSKLYQAYPNDLAHLKDLASARNSFAKNIDDLRNALSVMGEGAPDIEDIYKAFSRKDSAKLTTMMRADKMLPKEDRMFSALEENYNKMIGNKESEQAALQKIQAGINQTKLAKDVQFRSDKAQASSIMTAQGQSFDDAVAAGMSKDIAVQKDAIKQAARVNETRFTDLKAAQDELIANQQKAIDDRLHFLATQEILRGTRTGAKGFANLASNMYGYETIRSIGSLNPVGFARAAVLGKLVSPNFAAGTTRAMLNAPEAMAGAVDVAGKRALQGILTRSVGETSRNKEKK